MDGRVLTAGSSPRVRGTCDFPIFRFKTVGLIPAGAGNIELDSAGLGFPWAHPRGCGEHVWG